MPATLFKGCEQRRHGLLGNAYARVRNREEHQRTVSFTLQLTDKEKNFAALRRELHRVTQQIDKHLAQP